MHVSFNKTTKGNWIKLDIIQVLEKYYQEEDCFMEKHSFQYLPSFSNDMKLVWTDKTFLDLHHSERCILSFIYWHVPL